MLFDRFPPLTAMQNSVFDFFYRDLHFCTIVPADSAQQDRWRAARGALNHWSLTCATHHPSTEDLHRGQVALTSQFLTGHYATNAYLCRFGSRSDPNCSWCPSTFDDRRHRLFQCPRFDFIRQQLSTHIHTDTQGAHGWEWDFLVGSGRRYLAQFLDHVQRARS